MKKMMAAALAAGMMVSASPVMAAATVCSDSSKPCTIQLFGDDDYRSGGFTLTTGTGTGLTDYYNFDVPSMGTVNGQASSTFTLGAAGLTLRELSINGNLAKITESVNAQGDKTYSAVVESKMSIDNPQKVQIVYDVTRVGTYSGNVSWTRVAAVPEPATWALMILGFGVVGYAMRRRPSVRIAQAI